MTTEDRNAIVMDNLALVQHVAGPYRGRGVDDVDLVQDGIVGFLEGLDGFDPSRGTRWTTYVHWWIRMRIQQGVARGAYPVALTHRALQALAGNLPTTEGTRAAILGACRPGVDPADLEAERDRDADPRLDLDDMLRCLDPRSRDILARRFGLGGTPPQSLSEVGRALGISKERVRQVQDAALARLRCLTTQPDGD
jgi:RNA polymerase sigma factor (sigma-70 family)